MMCESCNNYVFDEEIEAYVCEVNMDEDDFARISYNHFSSCPYFSNNDDYLIVRKQM